MKYKTMGSLLPAICIVLMHSAAPRAAGIEAPNVIIVMTDDQGYGDLSCHGNPALKTPNLDRLHAQAIRFTDFHVAPMCTPTRGQLLTGMDAMANGATAVCQGRSMVRKDIPTMADIFAATGYRTGLFGKWHLGDSYPHRPEDRGFHETIHHGAWGITSIADYWGNTYWNDTYHHNGVYEKYTGYCADVWFDEAMKWMKARHEKGERFFAYLPTNTPHSPLRVDEKYSAPYKGQYNGKPMPALFYGMIANIDENMGRLEAFLSQTGLRENTILIFMTDNGCANRQAVAIHNAGMRGRKTETWEGGHRVPCFIRWPAGDLGRPRDIDQLAHIQDILPTLIDLCGLNAPAGARFDGVSLAGVLKGTQKELPDRMLVVQYGAGIEKWSRTAVLWKKWRLLGENRLYDLRSDPHQDTNVADKHSEVVQAMRQHYDQWWRRVEPLYNRTRYIHIGSDKANPMMLYSSDWDGGYADNPGNLAVGTAVGTWHIIVEQDGEYEFELRRWARESGIALNAPLNEKTRRSARPIAKARLKIGDFDKTIATPDGSTAATFVVPVKAGRATLETWFLDNNGKVLCSAFYTQVTKK